MYHVTDDNDGGKGDASIDDKDFKYPPFSKIDNPFNMTSIFLN
jgi:hypothetical protein